MVYAVFVPFFSVLADEGPPGESGGSTSAPSGATQEVVTTSHGGHRGNRLDEMISEIFRSISSATGISYGILHAQATSKLDGGIDFSLLILDQKDQRSTALCSIAASIERKRNAESIPWISQQLAILLDQSPAEISDILHNPRTLCSAWFFSRLPLSRGIALQQNATAFFVTENGTPFVPNNKKFNDCMASLQYPFDSKTIEDNTLCEAFHVAGTQWHYRDASTGEMVYFRWSGDPLSLLVSSMQKILLWSV